MMSLTNSHGWKPALLWAALLWVFYAWSAGLEWFNNPLYGFGFFTLPLACFGFHLRWKDMPPPSNALPDLRLAFVLLSLLTPFLWVIHLSGPEWRPPVWGLGIALDKLAASGKDWKPDLDKMRQDSLKSARGTHRLLGWLNARRELAEARLLLDSAPRDWLAQPPASLSAGETYLLQADWPALRLFLNSSKWNPQNPFRRLLELRWRKQQSNLEGGGTYETEAMTYSREIAPMPDILERALALVRSWDWDDLRILLLVERAKRWPQTELASLRELFGLYRKAGDIRGQFSVMIRVLETNPKDPVAMNNVAYLRMVLDEDVEKAHELAAKVVEENPKTFAFHPTLAVSLVLKKRASEALELFHEIPPEVMKTHEVRFAHALALAAAGRPKEGQDKLAGMVNEDFSKEEWLLLERHGLRKP